jgi:hypothetical protein
MSATSLIAVSIQALGLSGECLALGARDGGWGEAGEAVDVDGGKL